MLAEPKGQKRPAEMIDAAQAKSGKRGPYKKRESANST